MLRLVLAAALAAVPGLVEAQALESESSVAASEIGALESETVALLLSGNQGGQVAGAVMWTVVPDPELAGSLLVPLFIDVDGTTLLEKQQGQHLRVGLFAYALTMDGRIAGHLSQGVTLDMEAWGEPLRSSGLKFSGRLVLEPGIYSLRVLVRNQETGRLYLSRDEIEVPAAGGDAVTLLPPLFSEPASVWVWARQSILGSDQFSLDLEEERLVPAARAVLLVGKTTDLLLGGSGWDASASFEARLMDSRGRRVTEPVIKLDRAFGPSSPVLVFYRATLGPIDVPTGSYRLVITVTTGSGVRAVRSTPVVVIPSGGSMVWAALDAVGGDEAAAMPAAVGLSADGGLETEALATQYLHALRLLGQGDNKAAVEAVAELERTANAIRPVKGLEVVRRVEAEIALDLADVRAENLVPIVLLHRAVFRAHVASRSWVLVDHASVFTADLAEVAERDEGAGIAVGFAETILVSMAGDLVSDGSMAPGLRLLERALEVAPESRAALLGKGVALERLGRFSDALEPLRRLMKLDPENAEGRLRLAVNLARTGHEREAEPLLRGLIDSASEKWLLAIAYQELARMLIASGRGGHAQALIRAGLERLPHNQPLHVLLAYVLESSGQPWDATMVVENLRPRSANDLSEPRLRYVMWPILGIDSALVGFTRQAMNLQPDLLECVASAEARRAG